MKDDQSLDKLVYSFIVEDVIGGIFINVPPGHVGCVYDRGKGVLKKVYTPGLHFKIPFWQKAKLFNTQTLEYNISKNFDMSKTKLMGDEPVRVISSNGSTAAIEGTVLLRLDIDQIPHIWQNIGEEFVEKIIRPTVRSRTRLIASKYSIQEIISAKRDEFEKNLKEELERIFYPRGILVENVLLSEVRPTK